MESEASAVVTIVGGGLAGSEAAWQAAERGVRVVLYEMRPHRMTPAHETDRLAELVCSNSLGSDLPDRAPGLLEGRAAPAGVARAGLRRRDARAGRRGAGRGPRTASPPR